MKMTKTTFIIIFAALSLWVIGNLHIIGKKNFEYMISSEDYRYVINAAITDKSGKEKNYSLYAKYADFKESSYFFTIIGQGFFGPKYYNEMKITILEIKPESLTKSQIQPVKTKAP